ncbi:hypothetical protein HNV12_03210 [Methanococcoides sp. SA1]|nr:hypothetical protein [Methanococcoides sp. SA1]
MEFDAKLLWEAKTKFSKEYTQKIKDATGCDSFVGIGDNFELFDPHGNVVVERPCLSATIYTDGAFPDIIDSKVKTIIPNNYEYDGLDFFIKYNCREAYQIVPL